MLTFAQIKVSFVLGIPLTPKIFLVENFQKTSNFVSYRVCFSARVLFLLVLKFGKID